MILKEAKDILERNGYIVNDKVNENSEEVYFEALNSIQEILDDSEDEDALGALQAIYRVAGSAMGKMDEGWLGGSRVAPGIVRRVQSELHEYGRDDLVAGRVAEKYADVLRKMIAERGEDAGAEAFARWIVDIE